MARALECVEATNKNKKTVNKNRSPVIRTDHPTQRQDISTSAMQPRVEQGQMSCVSRFSTRRQVSNGQLSEDERQGRRDPTSTTPKTASTLRQLLQRIKIHYVDFDFDTIYYICRRDKEKTLLRTLSKIPAERRHPHLPLLCCDYAILEEI